ncbi:hypothetical protein HRbin36_02421 [bacterium HR36]|nr:hypothetical protein HRbin36_02421 [bacterium HR36]
MLGRVRDWLKDPRFWLLVLFILAAILAWSLYRATQSAKKTKELAE